MKLRFIRNPEFHLYLSSISFLLGFAWIVVNPNSSFEQYIPSILLFASSGMSVANYFVRKRSGEINDDI